MIVLASWSTLTPKANGQGVVVVFNSKQDNLATTNLGTVTIGPPASYTGVLQFGIALNPLSYAITYNPAAGYYFVKWETTGGSTVTNPNTQTTTLNVDGTATVSAVYSTRAVGGVIIPTNTLAVLAPYLALMGLVVTTGVVVAVKRRPKV